MTGDTSRALLELNRRFYRRMALQFSATRRAAWPGWTRVLSGSTGRGDRVSILDLGCGNGRFAAACAEHLAGGWTYVGLDASPELAAEARRRLAAVGAVDGRIVEGDLLSAAAWPSGGFDLVVLFGVLHHLPPTGARRDLLRRALARVAPGGTLAVSYWQLGDSARLMARTVDPAVLGLPAADLDADDHLLRWGEGDDLRYCRHCRPAEVASLADELGARTLDVFLADGEDGAMNLYQLLAGPSPSLGEAC